MADIKVRDLTDTSSVALDNQIMVLTNDENNQIQNITVENLLSNVLSSDNGNVLEQGTDGKLYVETPENITGDLADLDTVNKTSLVNSINEVVSNLSTEATTRANADNNLQSQIDAITAASDVTDIVGTYAQLQAYDTTGLPDNSIIKVLQDESRQNETTYYRWVITGGVGAWVLIGEEGPYYTKSQADSLFATQQTTGDLASLDTSDKTSLVNAINELSSVLDPTQTADYINNSKAVESGAISSNSIILSDVIKYAHSTFDLSKFTVVGSPNITDDGVATFNSTGYIDTGYSIPISKSIDIEGEFIITQELLTLNNENRIFGRQSQQPLLLYYPQFGWLTFRYYVNNTDTSSREEVSVGRDNISSLKPANLSVGDKIHYKCGYNYNTKEIYLKFKINNGNETSFTQAISYDTFQSSATMLLGHIAIGTDNSYSKALQDLKQFSITVDGVEVFSGNKTGIDTIKPDDYTVVGTPTISADGVASDLGGNSNYINTGYIIGEHPFKIRFKCSYASTNTGRKLVQIGVGNNLAGVYTQWGTLRFSFTGQDSSTFSMYLNDIYGNNVVGEIEFTGTKYILRGSTDGGATWSEVEQESTIYAKNVDTVPVYIGQTAYDIIFDLNSFKIYIDGNLVYQPCLKIPYTKGSEQYGGKYVNAQYLPRVKDAYEQGLANDYFTLDEVNGTYTLPMGNLYGMIEKLNQLAKDEIGLPKATLSNTLNDNEIWLEGAEVSKLTYSKLYAIYGDDYGIPTDSTNFVLPDFRDRVMQGIGSGGTFGYIAAGLPNITGSFRLEGTEDASAVSGAFTAGAQGGAWGKGHNDSPSNPLMNFDASRSSSIYGNSTTVQPPAIKVRVKTRFQ